MQCRTHPTATAVNTCNTCGEWLCEACTLDINGRLFCRGCLAKMAATPTEAPRTAYTRATRPVRWGLVFIFSFLPGASYMYLGLIKRGLAAMCGFFMLIYMLTLAYGSVLGWPVTLFFALSLPVCFLTYAFDSFNIRRRMLAGEVVPDNIDDIIFFFQRNKKVLLMLLIVVIGLGVVASLISALLAPLVQLIPMLIIGIGVYALLKKRG